MKGFILGFVAASLLGAGLVWAQQDGYITDQYGGVLGYTHKTPSMPQQDYMGPSRQMGQQLQNILRSEPRRNPC